MREHFVYAIEGIFLMGYWRWGWLLAILLTAAACTRKSDDQTPTLAAYTPDDSGGFAASVHPAITAMPVDKTLPALTLKNPLCQLTPTQALICQGWIENPFEIAYSDIYLEILLIGENGQTLAAENGMIAREWLPPETGSPYRLIFQVPPSESVTPMVRISSANPEISERLVSLEVQGVQMQPVADGTQISGTIHNPTENRLEPITLLITLFDSSGQLIGFRQLALEALSGNGQAIFETTFTATEAAQVSVTADGYQR